MKKLLAMLRDPVWQMIGVLVAVIGIFVAIVQSSTGPKYISIVHNKQERLVDQWLSGDRFKLLFGGATYDINRAVVDHYLIINESKQSIRPSSFVAPVQVNSASDAVRLVSVETCAKQHAQFCSPEGKGADQYVPTTWKSAGRNWVAENPHLNSGDSACVVVVSEHDKLTQGVKAPLPRWGARVEDYRVRVFDSLLDYERSREKGLIEYFWVVVILQGAGIWWFLMLLTVILFASLSLAGRGRWVDMSSTKGIVICIVIVLASVSTSEILVDIFVNRRGDLSSPYLHPVVWPLLAFHLVMLIYLARRALRVRRLAE